MRRSAPAWRFLDVIPATRPHLQHAEVQDAEGLPPEIEWPETLPKSPRNVHGVMPKGLNTRENPFAEDTNNVVMGWHRNLPHNPWSVNVLRPAGRGCYPDFGIGIDGRKTDDDALPADPKLNSQRGDEAAKGLAEHRSYGRVMILYPEGGTRWMTVGYDQEAKKPVLDREFRLSDAARFR